MSMVEVLEGITGIRMLGPDAGRPIKATKQKASGRPQPQFDNARKQEMEMVYKQIRDTQLSYVDAVSSLGPDTLQIHDLVFAMPRQLTPPTVIRIDKDMINHRWHTLRTNEVQKVTSGHSTARIYMTLYFVGMDAINNGLRRLLAIFNSLPFVYIENSFIRNNLTSSTDTRRNMACSLVNISVRTEPQTPNVLVADLTLLWFNYKPYATDFWFRKSWDPIVNAPENSQAIYDKEIVAAAGGPNVPAERDIAYANPVPKKDQTSAWSPPCVAPQNSEPLKLMVDNALGPIMSSMSSAIEIGFRKYKGLGALHGSTIAVQKTNDNLLKDVSPRYVNTNGKVLLRLHPMAAELFEQLAEEFYVKFSRSGRTRKLEINSCYRTRAMQLDTQKNKPDLASRGYSWHETGLAVDINIIGLTREEFTWLVNKGAVLGFKNLGTRSGYSPRFSDGGRYDSGGDPNARAIQPTSSLDSEGRRENWETWHFDFSEIQGDVMSRYGSGSTQTAIQVYKGLIHYTSSDIGEPIASEAGDEMNIEEIKQKEREADQEITARLERYLLDGWEVDPFASDFVRILLYKDYKFSISELDTQLIPQQITFAKSNIIAEIPILGHEYSTQQYMGSTDLDAVISFAAVGEDKIRELQTIITTIQENSRIAKGTRDASVIDIKNSVLNFGGMTHAIVDKIDVGSIPDSPGLYQVNLNLTQARRKERKDLNQERFLKLDAWREATRWAISNLFFIQPNILKDLKYIKNWDKLGSLEDEESIDNYGSNEPIPEEDLSIEPGTPGTDDRQWLIRTIQLLAPGIQKYVYNKVKYDETKSKKYSGFTIDYLDNEDIFDTPIAEVLREYSAIVAELLIHPFPKDLLFRLGLEGLVGYVEDPFEYDDLEFNPSAADLQTVSQITTLPTDLSNDPYSAPLRQEVSRVSYDADVKKYKSRLQRLWVRIYDEALYLHPVFGSLYQTMYEIFEQFRRGSECYPDLNLPTNRLTGSTLDTPPDYWFYNASVDGAMFSDKENILESAAQHMANSYESMKQYLSPEEWENTYISPNRTKIYERTTGGKSTVGTKLATLAADESGIGLPVSKRTLSGDLVGQVFDEIGYMPPNLKGGKVEIGGNNAGAEIKPDETFESEHILDGYSGRLKNMLEQSIQNFDSEIYRLARAYPTFKVEFIEEDLTDSGRLGIRNFDDFYSYSAIKDIRVYASRKMPASLCVLSITNIHGELDTLAYGGNDESSSARVVEKFDPLKVNTDQENPFTKLVVLEGSKIKVRLGYSNDPDALETVFNGQVVEVGVSDISPDILQLVCQSYGTELVAKLKTGGKYPTTSELLSALICSEECIHFGRFSTSAIYDPAEIRTATMSGSRLGLFGLNKLIDNMKENFLKKHTFLNKPQDDNIFTPEFGSYEDWGEKAIDFFSVIGISQILEAFNIVDDDRNYYPWRTTIWDVFKEMELRHPGYVSYPVPYGNRYTMFFGPPSHKYWSRPLSEIERGGWGLVQTFLDQLSSRSHVLGKLISGLAVNGSLPSISRASASAKSAKVVDMHGQQKSFDTAYKQYGQYLKWLLEGRANRYKPFRQYHFLSSENNIIANTIKASAHGTFNGIELTYLEDKVIKDDVRTAQQAAIEIAHAIDDQGVTIKLKADDNIEDKDTRMMQAAYTSCFNDFYARRYAVGLLMDSLRDVYKGTVMITGNPKIKPYDVCVLFDTYRDLYGPVEVESVEHIMSQETGFITNIKPDLIVTHNAWTTQSTMDGMVDVLSKLYITVADQVGETVTNTAGAAAVSAIGAGVAGAGLVLGGVGLGLLALGGYRLIQWSQERQPIVITPLISGMKPLIAGLDGYKRDNLWQSLGGRWKKFTTDFDEGWKDFWERSSVSKWMHEKISDYLDPRYE